MSAATAPVVPTKVHTSVQNLISFICELIGINNVSFTDSSWQLILQSPPDAQKLYARLMLLQTGGAPVFDQLIDPTTLQSGGLVTTLVAGTRAISLVTKATDLLAARRVTPGGTPGTQLAVTRTSATVVTINSLGAGNTLAASDTSIIEVYNFGTPAN